jgi:hypothetical protein
LEEHPAVEHHEPSTAALIREAALADPLSERVDRLKKLEPAERTHRVEREPVRARPRSFDQLDGSLGALISRRGINWRDVGAVAPDRVQQWSLWRIGADRPSPEELERAGAALEREIQSMHIDKRLVEAKLDRVQAALAAVPRNRQGASYAALLERFRQGKRLLDRVSTPRAVAALAEDVSRLEDDASNPSADLRTERPRKPTSPSTTVLTIDPPQIDEAVLTSTDANRPR